MVIAYYDLKADETLSIGGGRIRLTVRSLDVDGSILVEIKSDFHDGLRYLKRGEFLRLDKTTGVYNFGNRHHGRRAHVQLQIRGDRLPEIERASSG